MMILTSVRDVGSCDRNGTMIETTEGSRYMEGAVERLINDTREGGSLHGLLRIVGIVNDDLDDDMHGSDFPSRPAAGAPWIFPASLKDDLGNLVCGPDMTHHVPSTFRHISSRLEPERKAEAKADFERQIAGLMRQRGADLLLSDHYMARIDFLIREAHGLYGRVLNIHPAITVEGHPFCFRGPTPTKDAIDRARESSAVGEHIVTGATLHLVNPEIDAGPPISYIEGTPVLATDTPQELRFRNYQLAKLRLLSYGIRHYIEHFYPLLGSMNA